MNKYIWVIGCPRSGTTFLTDLIGMNVAHKFNEPGHLPMYQRGKVDQWEFPEQGDVVFKWCENWQVAKDILIKFPNSFFVHLTREPRNNVYSMAFPKDTALPPRDFPDLGNDRDERVNNAINRWMKYENGCRSVAAIAKKRYMALPYEQVPAYLPTLEKFLSISLEKTLPFNNCNIPEDDLLELEPAWGDNSEAMILRTKIMAFCLPQV